MNETNPRGGRQTVVLAALLTLTLAGSLAARLWIAEGSPKPTQVKTISVSRPIAAPASVPPPKDFEIAALKLPCWACPEVQDGAITFHTDLDLLAPLGNGTQNAAVWFADFAKPNGSRFAEALAATKRLTQRSDVGRAFLPNDPLLEEAEGWCDQATMRFYPEIFPITGIDTTLPNLIITLNFARSWIARGNDNPNHEAALSDYRRVIRLGRLLRQEDTILITDLVGLACIRMGSEAMYKRAIAMGDAKLALVASVVYGEAAPQKLLTAARITKRDVTPYIEQSVIGKKVLNVPSEKIEILEKAAEADPDRRFRGECLVSLATIAEFGTGKGKDRAREFLEHMAGNADPVVATVARSLLTNPPSLDEYAKQ